jgi:hypothetical protein
LAIYTDGSGSNGRIGAVAVCASVGTCELTHLSKETSIALYAAELQGIPLAIDIINRLGSEKPAIFGKSIDGSHRLAKTKQHSSGIRWVVWKG